MKQVTLCLCLKENEVLLAMKKRGFGAGKYNGYGGKVEEGETPKAAACRELKEESELVVEEGDLKQVALVDFRFDGELRFVCQVFLVDKWQGEPVETEEMSPVWYSKTDLPLGEMWAADALWFPRILAGETLKIAVDFGDDGAVVKSFACEPATFG